MTDIEGRRPDSALRGGAAYMIAAGHEERNKDDHCQRMLAMAQVHALPSKRIPSAAAASATVAPDTLHSMLRVGNLQGRPSFGCTQRRGRYHVPSSVQVSAP